MAAMSPSGLHVNKPVLFVILFGLILVLIFWLRPMGSPTATVDVIPVEKSSWKKGDWLEIPKVTQEDAEKVKVDHIKDKKIKVGDTELTLAYREVKPEGTKLDILLLHGAWCHGGFTEQTLAYREVKPDGAKLDVLLLHGAAFKSQTWVDKPMFTLQTLHSLGYRAVAIDLPGYGDSLPASSVDEAAYLETVIQELKLTAPVIISPSMSGKYSLAYLFKDPEHILSRCRGYVPVAPVSTETHSLADYEALQIPTLIVYGSKDTQLGQDSLKNLRNLPNSVMYEVEGGSHPCYLDQPEKFHSHLYTFLSSL